MEITLKPVTKDNFREVCSLKLFKEQKDLLSSNKTSLVEAAFNPEYVTRAIYLDEVVVGFFMWVPNTQINPSEIWICRFMIDKSYQNKGIGRRALTLAIEEIKKTKNLERIGICYWPRNVMSKKLYTSLGFKETRINSHGEMDAIIECEKT